MLSGNEWLAIRLIMTILAGCSAISAAFLVVKEKASSPEQAEQFRANLSKWWKWAQLPKNQMRHRRCIRLTTKLPKVISTKMMAFLGYKAIPTLWGSGVLVGVFISAYMHGGWRGVGRTFLVFIVGMYLQDYIKFMAKNNKHMRRKMLVIGKVFEEFFWGLLTFVSAAKFYTVSLGNFNSSWQLLTLIAGGFSLGISTTFIRDGLVAAGARGFGDSKDTFFAAVFTITLSAFMTAFAVYFGRVAAPDISIELTLQMVVANSIADGLTLWATLSCLRYAIICRCKFVLAFWMLVDLAAAVALAVLGLWLSVYGQADQLTLNQTVRVLWGISVDRNAIELSSLFWLMHTSFIPTIFVWAVVMLGWISSIVVKIMSRILGLANKSHVNPISYSAALCSLLFAFFFALAQLASVMMQLADQQ